MGLREEAPENKANKATVMGRKVGIKNTSIPLVPKKKQKHLKMQTLGYDIFIKNIMVKFLLVQTQHPMMRYKCELATKVRESKKPRKFLQH